MMKTPLFIAFRYFFSKKTRLVNLISGVSVASIGVSTAAMILILSVMNGMNDFVSSLYHRFDPEIRIESKNSRFFAADSLRFFLERQPEIKVFSAITEDYALMEYKKDSRIIKLKGVEPSFTQIAQVEDCLYAGFFMLKPANPTRIAIGYSLQTEMEIPINGESANDCKIYALQKNIRSVQWQNSIHAESVLPSAVYASNPEYDKDYVLAPLAFVQHLLDRKNEVSAFDIDLKEPKNSRKLIKKWEKLWGNQYKILSRDELHPSMYKSMKSEKLIVIGIFSFVLLIAAFTLTACLLLMVHEKKKDISILLSMGMEKASLRQIFSWNALFISVAGGLGGLFAGGGLAFLQSYFGLIRLGGEGDFILNTYPVRLAAEDFFMVFGIVLAVGALASLWPMRQIKSK